MKNGVVECSLCHSKLGVSPTTRAVSRAYDRHRSKMTSKFRARNVVLVVCDCLLIGLQWEALALLLIGISVNQLRSLPEGTTVLGLPVATGAYIYTLIFASHSIGMENEREPLLPT